MSTRHFSIPESAAILCQDHAQEYGSNVFSLLEGRGNRYRREWNEAIEAAQKPPTSAQVMGDTSPDGGSAA